MEVLQGYVEAIIFANQDNGYVVAKINVDNKTVTAVGIVPCLQEGQQVRLEGEWTLHKSFGKQFSIKKYEEIVPTTTEGIENYLSSGIIRGIGPVTAKKIINKFGEDTLNVMDNDINRLKEIEGIGEKKFNIIKESYLEHHDLRNVIIYFQQHGLSQSQCLKVYKRFGANAKDIIENDPYLLCNEVKGIGFNTADKIANSIGIDKEATSRISSGMIYVLTRFCGYGNTYMEKEKLLQETKELLNIEGNKIEEVLYKIAAENKVIIEKNEILQIEAVFIPIFYYSELGITKKIAELSMVNYQNINTDINFEINVFEQKNKIRFSKSQKEAILCAFTNGIEIITGGPGTGKTTIIKCIIEIYENQGMKVLLGAPTGRAAKRITESTGREAKTIHRMLDLGANDDEEFVENTDIEPLEGDVIIIDEASMIDIFLMHSLLKAIKLGTRVIIVGDVNQLPSVGPGNVLKDLINSTLIKVVRLLEIFRQGAESLIITNAHRINKGEMPLVNAKDKDFFFIKNEDQDKIVNEILQLVSTRLPKFNKSWDKRNDIQILSPMKKGILGVVNLNARLQEVLNPPSKNKIERKQGTTVFREGDKVMQIKNNYSIKWTMFYNGEEVEGEGVFNGDIGFIKEINNEERTMIVIFDEEKRVVYSVENMDELELAYAITIHKSQGSEFKVVIIPTFMGSPFLMNRNLIYTAITRAKELVTVIGYTRALRYMIDNVNSAERNSTLEYRIKDIIKNVEM